MNKINLFDFDDSIDTKYSTNVKIPQYLPKNYCPSLLECVDNYKYSKLINDINNSAVSNEEKDFLRMAATRHLVFNYAKIADYYAHASKEMQKLMENSALVIIDFNDAIANGYVNLSDRIMDIVKNSTEYKEKLDKYSKE